jgi:hypothetical protein
MNFRLLIDYEVIEFWEDHAGQHLKILDVHFADKSRG